MQHLEARLGARAKGERESSCRRRVVLENRVQPLLEAEPLRLPSCAREAADNEDEMCEADWGKG